ncbi:MAG: hypothetical protein R3B40_30815 [Polyangiales bacterium]|nr:DUF2834 domain-containing protein [Myxococcales bacterium]
MTRQKLLLSVLFVDFAALNAYVVYAMGYDGFVRAALDNVGTIAMLVDLAIALGLVLFWMVQDARRRGVSVLPYVPLMVLFGSVGPLLYLLRRPSEEATPGGVPARSVVEHA